MQYITTYIGNAVSIQLCSKIEVEAAEKLMWTLYCDAVGLHSHCYLQRPKPWNFLKKMARLDRRIVGMTISIHMFVHFVHSFTSNLQVFFEEESSPDFYYYWYKIVFSSVRAISTIFYWPAAIAKTRGLLRSYEFKTKMIVYYFSILLRIYR